MRYKLEIYEPKSHDTTLGNYEADTPFMKIDVGDIIEPSFLNGVPKDSPGFLVRAIAVQHMIYGESNAPTHKVCVYTEEVPIDTDLIP